MRKVGNMRVEVSKKTVREEEYKKKMVKVYIEKLEESLLKAEKGEIEWLGETEIPEEKKDKDEENDSLVYILLVKKENKESKYLAINITYLPMLVIEMKDKIQYMNEYLKEGYKSQVISMKEKLIKKEGNKITFNK